MTQLAVPQLLTGKIIRDKSIVDSIWKEANKNGSVLANSSVINPEKLSKVYMEKMNLGYQVSVGRSDWWKLVNGTSVGNVIKVPYGLTGHYTLGSNDNNIIYNPGNTTSQKHTLTEILLYGY